MYKTFSINLSDLSSKYSYSSVLAFSSFNKALNFLSLLSRAKRISGDHSDIFRDMKENENIDLSIYDLDDSLKIMSDNFLNKNEIEKVSIFSTKNCFENSDDAKIFSEGKAKIFYDKMIQLYSSEIKTVQPKEDSTKQDLPY